MVKDQNAAAKRGEVGLLDFDPFVDAQEWENLRLRHRVNDTAPGKAARRSNFTNLGQLTSVTLDLVTIKNDWRIRHITWEIDGKRIPCGRSMRTEDRALERVKGIEPSS